MTQRYETLVQEDLNVGTDRVWVTAPSSGRVRSTQVGIHTLARGQRAYEAAWAPGAIAAASNASTTITVPNATVGDYVMASHDKILTNNLRISGHVSAADTAKVVIHNPTASAITVPSGTTRALVFPASPSQTAPGTGGRMLYTSSFRWTINSVTGYPSWGYSANATAHDEEFCAAAVSWLLRGKTNAQILVCADVSVPGAVFDSNMMNFITSLGHTITRTNDSNNFANFDPNAYDLVMGAGWTGNSTAGPPNNGATNASLLDAYLAGGGSALDIYFPNYETRYGFSGGLPFQEGTSPTGVPDYLSLEFNCAPLGGGPYQISIYSSVSVIETTNTIGGTTTVYTNSAGTKVLAIWESA